MGNSIRVRVSPFGAFREFSEKEPFIVTVPSGSSITEVRTKLREELIRRFPKFSQQKLLDVSVFADEHSMLRNDHVLSCDTDLVIIPPISGG